MSLARLLTRIFEVEPEHCSNCGGELKVIAAGLEASVIKRPRSGPEATSSTCSVLATQRQLRGGELCDLYFGFGSDRAGHIPDCIARCRS